MVREKLIKVGVSLTLGFALIVANTAMVSANEPLSGVVAGNGVNLREKPSMQAKVLDQIDRFTKVTVKARNGQWYNVVLPNGEEGWVFYQYVRLSSPSSRSDANRETSIKVQELIDFAKSFLGIRYVWGGSTPAGFDCSGFVGYVFKNFGISLPRVAEDQAQVGYKVYSIKDLEPGDLVFFNTDKKFSRNVTHVGIYIGDGEFIHASSARKHVRIDRIDTGYYEERFLSASRLIRQ